MWEYHCSGTAATSVRPAARIFTTLFKTPNQKGALSVTPQMVCHQETDNLDCPGSEVSWPLASHPRPTYVQGASNR